MEFSEIALIVFFCGMFISNICLFSDVRRLQKEVEVLTDKVEDLEEK